ncbi:MAG: hypothetical protein AB1345_08305 [Chloroflexota bacterium]
MGQPSTIGSINRLPSYDKREIYRRLIPQELLNQFHLSPYLVDKQGNDLLKLTCPPGQSSAEMELRHQADFPDPILYGHITDTINGQIHVLLYILNDPDSPRFDVDRMPDGTPTRFGVLKRHTEAEIAAMAYGLTPGQIRRGLGMLFEAVSAFEQFVESLEHEMFFVEPLYYHNAVIFERYGFAYQSGRRLMERIQAGFSPGGDLLLLLDGSTPFRQPEAGRSIRLRSWAIHDGILGQPFTNVTMYKHLHEHAGISTCEDIPW